MIPHIERVWQANMQVYGADKVWKQLNRDRLAEAGIELSLGSKGDSHDNA